MRFIIILFFFCISWFHAYSQSWDLFPYDSVYFINPNNDMDALVPIVKPQSQGGNFLLDPMNIVDERQMVELHWSSPDYTYSHMLGNQLQENLGVITFNSINVNNQLSINLNLNVHEADTQMLNLIDGEVKYLKTYVDSIYFDPVLNDTLKSIQLILLDDIYTEDIFTKEAFSTYGDVPCVGSLYYTTVTSENIHILIGKTTGVREIPTLGMYPNSKMYAYYKTVDEVESILSQPVLEPGDVFDTEFHYGNYKFGNVNHFFSKTKVTSYTVNTITKTIDYITEYWKEDISDPLNPIITYNPTKSMSVSYGFDNVVFNGINENKYGESYLLRMNSEWGYPVIVPIGTGFSPYHHTDGDPVKYCVLHNIENLDFYRVLTSSEIYNNCVTYSNIDGVEYGTSNNIDLLDITDTTAVDTTGTPDISEIPFQVVYKGSYIKCTEPIQGQIQIFSVDGKQVFSQYLSAPVETIPLPNLPKGVYFFKTDVQKDIIKVPIMY